MADDADHFKDEDFGVSEKSAAIGYKTEGARKALYTSLTNSRTRLIPQSSYPNRHGESKFGNLKIKVKNYLGILHLLKDGAGAVLSGDSGMRRV